MSEKDCSVQLKEVTTHIKKLLLSGRTPPLTPSLEKIPDVKEIHEYLVAMRRFLGDFSRGEFNASIELRGTLAGLIKALQASMRHLIWQMELVQKGNLDQRIDFMGEFSSVFNGMVKQLDDAVTSLRTKEAELLAITSELRLEVEKRGAALSALKKSEENFRFLAEHDPLTGLLNRRSFFAHADVELSRATLMDSYSCIALMDVDHFKKFNDQYGHTSGDVALKQIASLGRETLRANDTMGRFGGEEFIFLFSKSTIEQGRLAAERVRAIVADTPVELPDDLTVGVTVSFGVAAINPGSDVDGILKSAIERADYALYRAKELGRNRVCVADKNSPESMTKIHRQEA